MSPAAAVARLVAGATGVPAREILASTRGSRQASEARRVAVYLAVVDLELGRAAVAQAFGRHPRTVRRALALIEDRRDDPRYDAWLTGLEERLVSALARFSRHPKFERPIEHLEEASF